MIDLLVSYLDASLSGQGLADQLAAHTAEVRASAHKGEPGRVRTIEAAVRANPAGCITFDARGHATLSAPPNAPMSNIDSYDAGHFELASLETLRARAKGPGAAIRFSILDGASPATDIGSLQATANRDTLFQVASQFNCLESPGPFVTPVVRYLDDPTQGPRASVSAFPGTFVRHYAAPAADGQRFVQTTDARQLDLLEAVCDPGVAAVRNGYLQASGIANPNAFAAALQERFHAIQVGVHDQVQVVLGYDWDGAVPGAPAARRHIGQVFTSTLAAGMYSGSIRIAGPFEIICRQLLRAAYLGTLLAAATLGKTRVVLTLIGGGVFGNPLPLIWEAILWSIAEAETCLSRPMDVVLNGRNLGTQIDSATCLAAIRARGGALVRFDHSGTSTVQR